jgi:hypothetical protein
MGAWSESAFGNDMACDWTADFAENPGLELVESALREVVDTEGYLESDEGACALAACEVIARLKGNWGEKDVYSEDIDTWVEANPQDVPQELVDLAVAVLDRMVGPESELAELWSETENDGQAWKGEVADLRRRVVG